jgi:predicted nucleotide-binding protein
MMKLMSTGQQDSSKFLGSGSASAQRFFGRNFGDYFFEKSVNAMVMQQMQALSRKIFVVHGHDEAALHAVARFLEQLKLEPIVLREQPDSGRTIIEKFEDYASEVRFAVVILTPDDPRGRLHRPPRCNLETLAPRPSSRSR